MKVVAYYALHYGKEWLEYSLRSIRNHVTDIVIVYTPRPSFGHGTNIPCPDTEEELRAIAAPFDVIWTGLPSSRWEGDHRDLAVERCKAIGADIVMAVDYDEIWEPDHLKKTLDYVWGSTSRHYRVPFVHYWRSTKWKCHDPALPERFQNVRQGQEGTISYVPQEYGLVHHFGYAISEPLMYYKWLIHGHLPELRPHWLHGTFAKWEPGQNDVHPTNHDFWNPVPVPAEERSVLSDLIGDHPYFQLDIIR